MRTDGRADRVESEPPMHASFWLKWILIVLPAAEARPIESSDTAKLQGRWETRAGARKKIVVMLEIKGRAVDATITTPLGHKVRATGELRLDESASPKTLDWISLKTADGSEVPDLQAIYRLDGDRFTLRSGGFNDPRPTDFEPGDGVWADVFIFERR
jgi:uncharacterized protein (TIGR03067 family)